jgi:DNA-binding NarL/FixJ family response regulator
MKNERKGPRIPEELVVYCDQFGLSPREKEVFALLTRKVIHFKEIAGELGLSPSTVNNHFKNIFDKTKTNSKSELLANFLDFVQKNPSAKKWLPQKPHVLVLDDEPDICSLLQEELTERGMKVYTENSPLEALARTKELKIDMVVSDFKMPSLTGLEFLKELRNINRYYPPLMYVTAFSQELTLAEAMDLGAVALMSKPIDIDLLSLTVMEQLMSNDLSADKSTDQAALKIQPPAKIGIGYGGVFIPVEEDKIVPYEVGMIVTFPFKLESMPQEIQAQGEIVWKRARKHGELPSGIGIKFFSLPESDKDHLHEYVRVKKIISFIPNKVNCDRNAAQ